MPPSPARAQAFDSSRAQLVACAPQHLRHCKAPQNKRERHRGTGVEATTSRRIEFHKKFDAAMCRRSGDSESVRQDRGAVTHTARLGGAQKFRTCANRGRAPPPHRPCSFFFQNFYKHGVNTNAATVRRAPGSGLSKFDSQPGCLFELHTRTTRRLSRH